MPYYRNEDIIDFKYNKKTHCYFPITIPGAQSISKQEWAKMQRNVRDNEKAAKTAAEQDKARSKEEYNPKDLSNSGKTTFYEQRAIPVYQDFKDKTKEFLESGTKEANDKIKEWENIDLNNKEAVNKFVIELLRNEDHRYSFDDMSCHNFAGILSAILDNRKIDHEVCMGKVTVFNKSIDHTWLRIGDTIYQKFRSNNQYEIPVSYNVITKYLRKKKEDK